MKKKKILIAIFLFLLLTTITTQQEILTSKFNLKEIEVENVFLLKEENIKKQLFQFYGLNFFLKNSKIEKVLLENNLIDSFVIKKSYPNTLKIKLFEKKLIAILIDKKDKFYLSEKMDLIRFEDFKNIDNLPYIIGSKKQFIILYNNLRKANFVIDDIKKYTLRGSNRWDLETYNKKIIKLPIKDYIESIKNFQTVKNNKNFTKYKIFDYRIKNQLILK